MQTIFILILLTIYRAAYCQKTPCGLNQFCYHIDIDRIVNDVIIQDSINGGPVTFYITFANTPEESCINPTLTFDFVFLDYGASSEYIDVLDDDSSLINRCNPSGEDCSLATYPCLSNQPVATTSISPGDNYLIELVKSSAVNNFCTGGLSIDAVLTLKCDFADADNDLVPDFVDNCPDNANPGQEDADFDGVGDLCDICNGGDDKVDADEDGIPDFCDPCPNDSNPSCSGSESSESSASSASSASSESSESSDEGEEGGDGEGEDDVDEEYQNEANADDGSDEQGDGDGEAVEKSSVNDNNSPNMFGMKDAKDGETYSILIIIIILGVVIFALILFAIYHRIKRKEGTNIVKSSSETVVVMSQRT